MQNEAIRDLRDGRNAHVGRRDLPPVENEEFVGNRRYGETHGEGWKRFWTMAIAENRQQPTQVPLATVSTKCGS